MDIDYSKWIGEGSDCGSIEISEDNAITISSATPGTPYNARLDADQMPLTDLYYEVKVVNMSKGSSLAVGLVSHDKFKPGWKINGYFYNGNVTNGSAGLIIGFGKFMKAGDQVGVYLRRLESQPSSIIFYHNKRCLGAGFCIQDPSVLYPCLHVCGSATVKVNPCTPPSVITREQNLNNSNDAYSGDWQINRLFVGPELCEFPLPQCTEIKLSLEKLGDRSDGDSVEYALIVKIANIFRTKLEVTGKIDSFDSIRFLGQCISTRKMPPPELQELESLIGKALNGNENDSSRLMKMKVTDDGALIISGPVMEMSCSRFVDTFEPVTSREDT
ncbi:hypothetical protein ACHAW6_003995 [Cyclotella cf. meneghiniana]